MKVSVQAKKKKKSERDSNPHWDTTGYERYLLKKKFNPPLSQKNPYPKDWPIRQLPETKKKLLEK